MQVQIDIGFDQLIKAVKNLPESQLKLLLAELSKSQKGRKKNTDLEKVLLNGPIATKKQLQIISKNRKSINQWRTK